jgi:Amidohydrolase family
VRNVGLRGGQIAAIGVEPLAGRQTVDVSGLVVAPGFIDLHAHGQETTSAWLQARDGVTTALDMELGVFPVGEWYASRAGTSPRPPPSLPRCGDAHGGGTVPRRRIGCPS